MALAPGGRTPLHVHTEIDGSYYVLSGRLAVRCGDARFVAGPGDYVSQPVDVPRTFSVLDG